MTQTLACLAEDADLAELEQKIWRRYRRRRSDADRNWLIERYYRLVVKCAYSIKKRLPHYVEVDDMISAGVTGLLHAIKVYTPDRGVKFATFCVYRIRGAILDSLRNTDWVSRTARSWMNRVENARHEAQSKLGRPPTEQEVAKELGVSQRAYRHANHHYPPIHVSQATTIPTHDDSEELSLLEMVPDKEQSFKLSPLERQDLKQYILKQLSPLERQMIIMYYYDGLKLREVGTVLGFSESRASQMMTSIIAKLKTRLRQ